MIFGAHNALLQLRIGRLAPRRRRCRCPLMLLRLVRGSLLQGQSLTASLEHLSAVCALYTAGQTRSASAMTDTFYSPIRAASGAFKVREQCQRAAANFQMGQLMI